jgi:hypothetical protein
MANSSPRHVLESGVAQARVMQVATLMESGAAVTCQVWFQANFQPDRLYFISRRDRQHSINIRRDARVSAGVPFDVPQELGDRVRGVTLTGNAREVPQVLFPVIAQGFIRRWPRAVEALTPRTADPASTPSRLYEIAVLDWVLFDEMHFPAQPRVVLDGL